MLLGSFLSKWVQADTYAEFRIFVENTERELYTLFNSIDRDHDGRLDKSELRGAFKKAGLSVPDSKLNQFFAEVDRNHDVGPDASYQYDFQTNVPDLGIYNLCRMEVREIIGRVVFLLEPYISE